MNDAEFREAVRLGLLKFGDAEVAKQFDISRPVLKAWREGKCYAHPALRPHILRFLETR